MLNLGSKTSPSSQIFSIPSNFRNHRWGTETGAFPWPSCIVFVKNDRITILVPIILSINQWSIYQLKKSQIDNQKYISQLSASLCFYKLLFEVKKNEMKLNKTLRLKFILMLFDSVYPIRPSDTVTKYTIYPLCLIGGKITQMVLGLILQLYCMASKTWLKNALHFTFWGRIFARVRFYKSSFFILSFRHQYSNRY